MSLLQKPVEELAPLLQTKQVSPLELVRECLDRIAQTEPLVNAYISVLDESALTAARAAEQEILQGRYRGLLHGIPYSAKDLYFTKGVRTTAGSAILAEHTPTENAAAIDRLEAAGAILVGKNNLHEFAYGTTNENDHTAPAATLGICSGSPVAQAVAQQRRWRQVVRHFPSGPIPAVRFGFLPRFAAWSD